EGMKIGLVDEGFGWEGYSDEQIDELVNKEALRLQEKGAIVERVSVPMHREGLDIWSVISTEGPLTQNIQGNSQGTNALGYYQTRLLDAFSRGLKTKSNALSHTMKFAVLLGHYMKDEYGGRYYSIAQNLRRTLTEAYDVALEEYDVLVMPTVSVKPSVLPAENAGVEEIIERAYEPVRNTAQFNLTGHPALSAPCGFVDGLPVGMMLVGRHMEDDKVLQVAGAYEELNRNK